MNPSNEVARIVRSNIETIDRILDSEHITYKQGKRLKAKRDEYAEYLKKLVPTLQGVDF